MSFVGLVSLYVLTFLVWFKTDAFAEYGRLLHLSWTKADDYYLVKESDPAITYHKFLLEYYNCFFVRLITCPICLGLWFGILLSPPLVILFGWWAPSLLVCLGLFLFFILAMLMNKYE